MEAESPIAVFVRVAESGSLSEAARRCGLPKSTISRRLARLEACLGGKLLERGSRQVRLTESGKRYYAQVKPALDALVEAGEVLRDQTREVEGLVRLTAPHDFGDVLTSPLKGFVDAYPQICVDLDLDNRFVDLSLEDYDLALRAGELGDSNLMVRPIGISAFWLAAHPDYLAAQGMPERAEDLARHACILFRGQRRPQVWVFRRSGPRASLEISVEVRGQLRAQDYQSVLRFAEAGAGVARLPSILVKGAVKRGTLQRVLPELISPGAKIQLVYASKRYLPRRVQLLRDHLAESLRSSLAG